MAGADSKLMSVFRCESLEGSLSYRTCLLRRVSVMPGGGTEKRPRYPECAECSTGRENERNFRNFNARAWFKKNLEQKRDALTEKLEAMGR